MSAQLQKPGLVSGDLGQKPYKAEDRGHSFNV
jgi:hypothetical protein